MNTSGKCPCLTDPSDFEIDRLTTEAKAWCVRASLFVMEEIVSIYEFNFYAFSLSLSCVREVQHIDGLY